MSSQTTTHSARFRVGQVIQHRLFEYRGVVFDVDPVFQGSDEWYERMAQTRPPRNQPWYHVLPDGETHTTYVAERNLTECETPHPISHPELDRHFTRFARGAYVLRRRAN